MSDLPVNIDTTYDDDGADASVKAHQQHHDALHAAYNDLAGASPDLAALGIAEDDHNHTGTYDPAGTASTAVAAHSADTTSVHGIADTTVLATDAEVTSAVSTHAGAVDPHGDRAYADGLASDYATAAQGGLADSAVQPGDTIPVADGGTGATTAADARTNLDVDQAGTDNSTDVTLAGTPDYLTIAGQVITRGLVDLTTDVTGDLPVTEGGTGSSTASGARTNLGLVIGTDVAAQSHAASTSNPHSVTKAQVGLANADNTSDANKPVSTAQQTALDLKANVASPALTGTPTVPTAAQDTATTQAASTEFVVDQIQADTDEVGDGDFIAFENVGGVQTPYPLPGLVYVEHSYSGLPVANTTTESTLAGVSGPWATAANEIVLGTNVYQVELFGTIVNNSGSDRNTIIRVKVGSTTILTVTFTAIPTGATGRPFNISGYLKFIDFVGNDLATGGVVASLGAAGGGTTLFSQNVTFGGIIDVSIANNVDVTAQHSSAASTITAVLMTGIVKRVQ